MQFQIFILCFLRLVYEDKVFFAPKKGLYFHNNNIALVIDVLTWVFSETPPSLYMLMTHVKGMLRGNCDVTILPISDPGFLEG